MENKQLMLKKKKKKKKKNTYSLIIYINTVFEISTFYPDWWGFVDRVMASRYEK